MIRFLAIDIDGTLLDSRGGLPEENRAAIGEAIAHGVEVALVTGRGWHFTRPVATLLPRPLMLIVNNGALVKTLDGETKVRHLMACEVARDVIGAAADYRSSAAVVFDRAASGQLVTAGLDWRHPKRRSFYRLHHAVIEEVSVLEDCLIEDPVGVMFSGGVDPMRALAADLRTGPAAERYTVVVTEYVERDFTLVDVLAAGVSKGSTVQTWTGQRGYLRGEIMAVGDNHNDRQMLEAAGVPVVMGNAVPGLKALGFHLTGTNDDAGLAAAIRRFLPLPPRE